MRNANAIAAAVSLALSAAAFGAAAADKSSDAASASSTQKQSGDAASGSSTQKKSGDAASGSSKQKQQEPRASSSKDAPVIVLVPVAIATANDFGDGCWARLYDDDDFGGNQLSLVGPVDMPNMRTAFGTDWSGDFESVAVGPAATVTVYDNENYRQRVATFKPGQRLAELDEKMGFFEQIRSLKIACAGGAARGGSAEHAGKKQDGGAEAAKQRPGGGTQGSNEKK